MKLIESARMEGIVDISIKSKESSVVNGIKSISNGGGSATAEEDLIDRTDADETTDLNDQVWPLTHTFFAFYLYAQRICLAGKQIRYQAATGKL